MEEFFFPIKRRTPDSNPADHAATGTNAEFMSQKPMIIPVYERKTPENTPIESMTDQFIHSHLERNRPQPGHPINSLKFVKHSGYDQSEENSQKNLPPFASPDAGLPGCLGIGGTSSSRKNA